jgi:LmbE family N-acetylglucosaminyl deacetylase
LPVEELARRGAYDSLYLSPHLDDAALSCPGSILSERAAGRRLLVVTVFSAPGEASRDTAELYALRRQEDENAALELEVDFQRLDFVDAPFRSPAYGSFNGIIFGRDPGDDSTSARLADQISQLIAQARPDTVYAPLAVGGHIDHRLTCEAARRAGSGKRVLFYEDRPYAFVLEAVTLRLAELGFAGPGPSRWVVAARFFPSFFRARYVRSYLRGASSRVRCAWRYARQLGRVGACQRGAEARRLSFDRDLLARARRVVSAYGSQVPDLFGDLEGYERAATDYSARLGSPDGYAERLWELKTPSCR